MNVNHSQSDYSHCSYEAALFFLFFTFDTYCNMSVFSKSNLGCTFKVRIIPHSCFITFIYFPQCTWIKVHLINLIP